MVNRALRKNRGRRQTAIAPLCAALTVVLTALTIDSAATAVEIKPAIVYSQGGKFDKSFNEGVFEGAQRFQKDTGIAFQDFEITNETQYVQAHRKFVQRGADPIIAVGFTQTQAIKEVAEESPDTRFTLIDSVVDLPNVQSIVFREHEGSFLVGVLAAMASTSGKIGFVGGMDIPLIRRFACGYLQGARHAIPEIEVIQNMTGPTPAAWADPGRGAELAKGQFDRGADVIYAAAGTTGLGVLQAAADNGKLAIGVDSNQNHLHPGTMLTSMVKRVDLAAYNSFENARNGDWAAGVSVLGLAEEGVDWAYDTHNEALITEEMKTAVEAARVAIIDGKIVVQDYMADNRCATK